MNAYRAQFEARCRRGRLTDSDLCRLADRAVSRLRIGEAGAAKGGR